MSNQTMRALTIVQPWAHVIVHGSKRVENRTWQPPRDLIGRFLAIHAGKSWDESGARHCEDRGLHRRERLTKNVVVFGAVVGIARVVRCAEESLDEHVCDDPWFCGPFGWVLDTVTTIEPVPCKGAQGLWRLPRDVHDTVMERAQKARVSRG